MLSLRFSRFALGADKVVALLVGSRNISHSSADSKPQRISKNLSFRPAYNSHLVRTRRPLVILYGWLVAKSQHMHKYGDFYLGKGFDVLHVKVDPTQLLLPTQTQKVITNIIDFVTEEDRIEQPLLSHGFSVGGYLYGETLVKIHSDPNLTASVGKRIKGQIFDSPVDVQGIPSGFSKAVTQYKPLQKTMEATLNGYLKLFKTTTAHYLRASGAFHENLLSVPSCFLYSSADPVADASVIESLIEEWSEKGLLIDCKKWHDTPHVSHFLRHPVQYISKVNEFLVKIGFEEECTGQRDKIVMVN